MTSESEEKENIKLDSYNAMSVVCALIFGFSITILHSDLLSYDDLGLKSAASNAAIILGSIATGASMLAALEFVMEIYHGKKLLHKYGVAKAREFSSNKGNKINKKIARHCTFLSLCCLVGQIIARSFALEKMPSGIAYAVTIILSVFLLMTIVMQHSDIVLIETLINPGKDEDFISNPKKIRGKTEAKDEHFDQV
mmetsp:Transcript_35518/g.52036  ORF Transcript_35518/g.52036 Transcript_35518/m.52036 type:complete len:196 (-) Transcript_35518:363-950(-)